MGWCEQPGNLHARRFCPTPPRGREVHDHPTHPGRARTRIYAPSPTQAWARWCCWPRHVSLDAVPSLICWETWGSLLGSLGSVLSFGKEIVMLTLYDCSISDSTEPYRKTAVMAMTPFSLVVAQRSAHSSISLNTRRLSTLAHE